MLGKLLEAAGGPTPVRVDLTVSSPDAVSSARAGAAAGGRAAVVWIEVVERGPPPSPARRVGAITLGDTLALEDDAGTHVLLLPRRATLRFPEDAALEVVLDPPPPDLVSLLCAARGEGELSARAFLLRRGDRVRLDAVVEPGPIVRDDLAPVVVELLRRPAE